jgi:hypothetical protein
MRLARCGAILTLLAVSGTFAVAGGWAASPVGISFKPAPIGAFRLDRVAQQGGIARGIVPVGTIRLIKDGVDVVVARDGQFIIAFGRDHAVVAILSATLRDGRYVTERINVAPRAWQVQSLPTLPYHQQPDVEFEERRPLS